MNKSNNIWNRFAEKHPSASKWIREGGLFVIVSNLITVLKYVMLLFLPLAFAGLPNIDFVSRESTLHYSVRHLNGISSDMMRRMADCRTSVHT
mgnify:FL=1